MIPQTFHHIWIGPKPVPEGWISAWQAMHPGWTFRLWREADLAGLEMPNRKAYETFLAAGNWHGASDIARVAILAEHGGVYVDVDSKPLRPFSGAPFMASSFFAAYEPTPSLPGRLANGTIGSAPGHPILSTYARLVGEMSDLSEPWDTCGGTGLTAAVLVHRQCCKPMILPARTFYATDAHGHQVPGREVSYSEHFWATTNHVYPVKAVILVPRRAGDPARDRAWEYVKRHWAAMDLPIIEGHHEGGRFNASAARNRAAERPWDVGVFVDADTVMLNHEPVRQAIRLAASSGQMVRPYNAYWIMDEAASDAFMATGQRQRGRPIRGATHGGVNVVPRALWDAVGGYDERFVGWGSEDTAFEIACRVLGGFRQLRGEVFHLWHPISADRNTSDPGFIANVALRNRYEQARTPAQMRALIANQPPPAPTVGAVVITNGRRDAIATTIPSFEARVGPFAERIICDDSGDPAYVRWLTDTFPAWTVKAHPHLGHGPAVAYAIREAAAMDVEWVFWSEDDIEYLRPVDVKAMIGVMEAQPDLKQLVVKRQAWFPTEVQAGGMIERFDPALFTEHSDNGSSWIEHRQFFSLNPFLAKRALLAVIRWPPIPNSEHEFSRRLFRDPRVSTGIWGKKADEPWVKHFGERIGSGY